MLRSLIFSILLLCLTLKGGAQLLYLPQPEPSDTITISLLTCAPGDEVYELEGHTALRLQYAQNDIVANWGVFDFAAPNFVYRFCKGETDYSIGVFPTSLFLSQYAYHHRRVTEQVLNLTNSQADIVLALIDRNLQPENRVYRYNYVLDNCATRPLSIIEKALGDSIHIHYYTPTGFGSPATFRSAMRYYHAHYPWYQFGIDLALGTGIDYAIDQRLACFAPVVLQDVAATATISTPKGEQPLVRETIILVDGPANGVILPPTPWYLTPLAAGWLIFAIALLLTIVGVKYRRQFKGFDAALFGTAGIMGCVIAFLVFISVHEATSPNWVLAWLNPIALMVPALIFFRKGRRWLRPYFVLNAALCIIAIAIAIFGVQAFNPAFYPLILTGLMRSVNFIFLPHHAKN